MHLVLESNDGCTFTIIGGVGSICVRNLICFTYVSKCDLSDDDKKKKKNRDRRSRLQPQTVIFLLQRESLYFKVSVTVY